ncbi:MAG: glycerol-3-phosphate responsive antiterminator [Eubacteriales bacterium]
MKKDFLAKLNEMPIVASVKDEEGLNNALDSECGVVFIIYGDICSIGRIVSKVKESGKIAIVHIDFIEGLASREIAVRYIKENTSADGIISTKPGLIKAAKGMDLIAIQRYFLIDSISLNNFKKQIEHEYVDAVEILPGVMPKIIKKIVSSCHAPIIIGGFISDKEDVMVGLQSGAIAVSSTKKDIWFLL